MRHLPWVQILGSAKTSSRQDKYYFDVFFFYRLSYAVVNNYQNLSGSTQPKSSAR